MAAADHEQHAAEAQVDEANEDLDGLQGAGGVSARRAGGLHTAACRPRRKARTPRLLGNKLRLYSFEISL